MDGTAILHDIIEIMVSGLTQVGSAIGSALSTLAQSIFLTTVGEGANATTELSVFGILVIAFAGIALALGLARLVVGWLTSLGGSHNM